MTQREAIDRFVTFPLLPTLTQSTMATLMSDSSSDQEEDTNADLKINTSYANAYNRFREKEVFQTLKDRYGEDAAKDRMLDRDSDTSSSDEEEDEEAEELTEEVERDFFKVS